VATPTVLACSTDKDPECRTKIAITANAGANPQVVMALKPGGPPYSSMPDLGPGDRIEVTAELEVTTDAPDLHDAVGKPYGYSPKVRAQLLLAAAKDPGSKAIPLTPPRTETCAQAQHHHRLVFDAPPFEVPARGLPWTGDSRVNLVLSAYDPGAKDGQVLLIGQNEPPTDGKRAYAKGDMGKISVVRYRGRPEPKARLVSEASVRNSHVPVAKGASTVVYSLRLEGLEKDEQLLLEGRLPVNNSHSYPVRVATQAILGDSPQCSDLHSRARDLASYAGEIGKYNGTNCMPRASYTTQKFGTLRILKTGRIPLFVNLVVSCGDPEHRAAGDDTIKVEPGGFLKVRRFPAKAMG
jgi:hypothetical protein